VHHFGGIGRSNQPTANQSVTALDLQLSLRNDRFWAGHRDPLSTALHGPENELPCLRTGRSMSEGGCAMKSMWGWLCVLTIAAAAAVASMATTPASIDVSKIRTLESRYAAALVAKDLNGIMRSYTAGEDLFVFEAVPPRQFVGARAYRQHVQEFLVNFHAPFTYEVHEIVVTVTGDIAYGHSIQHLIGMDGSGNRIDMTFRVTDVYRKIKGDWFITQEHASFPVDPQTGKADFSSAP
jgi:ketosteroid isomerase-like protein